MSKTRGREETRRPGCVLSAGVVIVRRFDGEPRYLLLRVYNYWDFPKGVVEAGEDPLAAAEREAAEETTLRGLHYPWGPVWCETPPYRNGKKVARYYLAESHAGAVSLSVSAELGRPEHDEYHWLAYPAARALLGERLRPILDWAHARVSGEPIAGE